MPNASIFVFCTSGIGGEWNGMVNCTAGYILELEFGIEQKLMITLFLLLCVLCTFNIVRVITMP